MQMMDNDLAARGTDFAPSAKYDSHEIDWPRFPILLGTLGTVEDRERQFRAALHKLSEGLHAGAMRKVTYGELKDVFARTVDWAWDRTVGAIYFHEGKYESLPKDVQDLNWSISLMSLHDVLSTKRKLDRSKCTGPAVEAMKAVIDEANVLAVAMAGLKGSLVKGRAAGTDEQRERAGAIGNPDKIVMTCACCFRRIAMAGETMAHHGYERPGFGSQTASCMGIRFRPLEVSSEGLECILAHDVALLERLEHAYSERETVSSISRMKERKLATFNRGEAHWERELLYYVSELEAQIRFTRESVTELKARLAGWVQTQPVGLSSVRKQKTAKREEAKA